MNSMYNSAGGFNNFAQQPALPKPWEDAHSCKREYYLLGNWGATSSFNDNACAYQGRIYYLIGEYLCVSDMDGSNKRILAKYSNPNFEELIVNSTGIYLFNRRHTSGGLNMIRFDLNGKILERLRKKGNFSDVYIYDDSVFYVQTKYNHPSVMLYQFSTQQEICIFDQATEITQLCGNDKQVFFRAFFDGKNGMVDGWLMYSRSDGQLFHVNCGGPIVQVDFVRGIFWVAKTVGGETYWVAQGMSSNDHGWEVMPRWKVSADLDLLLTWKRGRVYFDGEHLYAAHDWAEFEAFDPSGRSSGKWDMEPHGDVGHFQVMDQMLMINSSGYEVDFYPLSFESCDPIRRGWFGLGGFDGNELSELRSLESKNKR